MMVFALSDGKDALFAREKTAGSNNSFFLPRMCTARRNDRYELGPAPPGLTFKGTSRTSGKRHCSRSLFSRLFLALAVTSLLSPGVALATRIPGIGDIANGYYFTTDMGLVKVALRAVIGEKSKQEPLAQFEIPRAYIYLTSHHSEKQYQELPSEIEAQAIYVILTYPDGLPYSIALAQRNKTYAAARREGATEVESPVVELRSLLIKAEISVSVPNAYHSAAFTPREYERYVDDYGALKRHGTLGSSEVYFGQPEDLIRKIRCPSDLENADPRHLCTYYTVLSSHVMAKVSFVDFRVHGGISFAQERIRAFKATVCQFINCD